MNDEPEWEADPRTLMAKLDIDTTQVDIRDLFELDLIAVKVEDLWRVVFGPNKPFPTSGTPWVQAMTQIQAACLQVRWQWMDEPKRPPLRLLPVGVELEPHGSENVE